MNVVFLHGVPFEKYSNKSSMKALVEKDIIMKKQEKEMRKAPHFFYVHLSRELEGTQGNSKFFKGSARRSNRRKKLRKRGKEGKHK